MNTKTALFTDMPVQAIVDFQDTCLATPNWAKKTTVQFDAGLWQFIEHNHRFNIQLWDEEDRARRRDVGDDVIASTKRAIDQYNQKRQDAIEKIDELLLMRLQTVRVNANARQNSETAGSIIDRLSIISLKIYHMNLQCQRADVDEAHLSTCKDKHKTLCQQRDDLKNCLGALLEEASTGCRYFKIYRQFKMYNDAALNPYLYQTQT